METRVGGRGGLAWPSQTRIAPTHGASFCPAPSASFAEHRTLILPRPDRPQSVDLIGRTIVDLLCRSLTKGPRNDWGLFQGGVSRGRMGQCSVIKWARFLLLFPHR